MTTPTRRRPGRPRKDELGDTRAVLLDAALGLFARHGYAGTSIRAIAREVGMSESVLYGHFPSKRAIFDAALAEAGPHVAVSAVDALAADLADTDPPGYVRAFAAALVEAWDTPRARQLASLAARDGLMHHPDLSGGIEQALQRLATVVARWQETGAVDPDAGSPDELAYALLAPIAHARMLWLHADATADQRRLATTRMTRHAAVFAALTVR